MSQRPGASASLRAEYYAKQGLAVGSIRRMVKYEFGVVPSDSRIALMVEQEAYRRARFKAGVLGKLRSW